MAPLRELERVAGQCLCSRVVRASGGEEGAFAHRRDLHIRGAQPFGFGGRSREDRVCPVVLPEQRKARSERDERGRPEPAVVREAAER